MKDGTRIGAAQAADYLGVSIRQVSAATEAIGFKYDDIREFIQGRKEIPKFRKHKSYRVEQLNPKEVYKLAKYSAGQRNHTQILMELLGLHSEDREAFIERFPDA